MLIIIIAVIILLLFFLYGYLSHLHFVTKTYDIVTNGRTGDHRFVVIADLHDCRYGEGNKKLLDKIDEISPDIVLIPGDLTVKHDTLDKKSSKKINLKNKDNKNVNIYGLPAWINYFGNYERFLTNRLINCDEISAIAKIKWVKRQ